MLDIYRANKYADARTFKQNTFKFTAELHQYLM